MQRQTLSCVDIHEAMPVDSSTAGFFFRGGLELHVEMQRQNPSCVDIPENMPVDSSTTGLFLGGLELHAEMQRQTPACGDIHETHSGSTAGLSLGGFGVA